MKYLLDTNVVSELVKIRHHPKVVAWLKALPQESLHLSVLTLGEIRKGVERMEVNEYRERIVLFLQTTVHDWFGERLLAVDAAVADRWGRLAAAATATLPAIDLLLAATAQVHGLTLVTRNIRHFASLGVDLVNPWED